MYYGSDYACELGNGWFFGFNLGTLLSDKYLEGQGLVDYIRQAIETKTIPDELLQPRGSYGSAVVGMYDLNEVPPVFWYRGDLVDISRDRGEGIHSYTLPAGDEIIYVDYITTRFGLRSFSFSAGWTACLPIMCAIAAPRTLGAITEPLFIIIPTRNM